MSPEESSDALPRLLLIADQFTDPCIEAIVASVITDTSLRWVQLRDHSARRALFRGRADCLIERLRASEPASLFSINSDVELASNLEAGIHLGVRGPSVAEARERLGEEALIGFSAHDIEEAERAVQEGADYISFSPIFETASKPGHPGIGLDALVTVSEHLEKTPVVALGGITPERVEACLEAGAHGVAVVSGIFKAVDPVAAADRYYKRVLRGEER